MPRPLPLSAWPVGPVEAFAQAASCSRRQAARPSFSTSSCSVPEAQHHGAARRRIAHRVVEQVAQQHGQQVASPSSGSGMAARRRPFARQFDAAALGQRQGSRSWPARRPAASRLGRSAQADVADSSARQRQHLRDQPVHAVQAGAELRLRPARALRRFARGCTTSHCARSTASGVRSSCAASAVKRRSRVSRLSMRANRPFMAARQRLELGGRASVGHGRRSSALARCSSAVSSAQGRQRVAHRPAPWPAAAPAAPAARARAGWLPGRRPARRARASSWPAATSHWPRRRLQVVDAPGPAAERIGPRSPTAFGRTAGSRLRGRLSARRPSRVPDRHRQVAHISLRRCRARLRGAAAARRVAQYRQRRDQRGLHLARQADDLGVEQLVDLVPRAARSRRTAPRPTPAARTPAGRAEAGAAGSWCRLSLAAQRIAHAAHGAHDARIDLAAQVVDVHLQRLLSGSAPLQS